MTLTCYPCASTPLEFQFKMEIKIQDESGDQPCNPNGVCGPTQTKFITSHGIQKFYRQRPRIVTQVLELYSLHWSVLSFPLLEHSSCLTSKQSDIASGQLFSLQCFAFQTNYFCSYCPCYSPEINMAEIYKVPKEFGCPVLIIVITNWTSHPQAALRIPCNIITVPLSRSRKMSIFTS